MASKNPTMIATPVYSSTGNDNLAVADVYSETGSTTKVLTEFKSVTSEGASKIASTVKSSKITDLTSVIKVGDSTTVDKAALLSRIEDAVGVRLDGSDNYQGLLKSSAVSRLTSIAGTDSNRIVDELGEVADLENGVDFKTASGISDFLTGALGLTSIKKIVDSNSEYAVFGTILGVALSIGLVAAVDDILDKIKDKKAKRQALIDSLESCARAGNLSSLVKIKEYIGGPAMLANCPEVIALTMAGYEFPVTSDESKRPNYQSIYNTMVGLFNEIDPEWVIAYRQGTKCTKLKCFADASEDTLLVFSTVGDYKIEALVAQPYGSTTLKALSAKQFVYAAVK